MYTRTTDSLRSIYAFQYLDYSVHSVIIILLYIFCMAFRAEHPPRPIKSAVLHVVNQLSSVSTYLLSWSTKFSRHRKPDVLAEHSSLLTN